MFETVERRVYVIPGPGERLIVVHYYGKTQGWTLTWKDTGELIQHRILGPFELMQNLQEVLGHEIVDPIRGPLLQRL